jgi:hypothetical protein
MSVVEAMRLARMRFMRGVSSGETVAEAIDHPKAHHTNL